MVAVVSSNPIGVNFICCWNFSSPWMSILYRNVRFVLKIKTPTETKASAVRNYHCQSEIKFALHVLMLKFSTTNTLKESNFRCTFLLVVSGPQWTICIIDDVNFYPKVYCVKLQPYGVKHQWSQRRKKKRRNSVWSIHHWTQNTRAKHTSS